MKRYSSLKLPRLTALAIAMGCSPFLAAQNLIEADLDDSNVVYEAGFFDQYSPVSVNDMIDRIPGISLALNNRGNNNNRRGLGSGEGEILINGQRITGKSNEGRSQLSRISANQVDYIEIIRGTSDDMEIRSGGQVVNVVLLEAASRSSVSAEISTNRLSDGTYDPGAQVSFAGQTGALNYLFHIQAEPDSSSSWRDEQSFDADNNLIETRFEDTIWDRTEFQTSINLGYQMNDSAVQFNALYEEADPTRDTSRLINEYTIDSIASRMEREESDPQRSNWEIGGDYEYQFNNGGIYRFLFIVNDREFDYTAERFDVLGDSEDKNRYLYRYGGDQERIARTSYSWDLNDSQGLEFGIERAQTIRDNDLRLGLADSDGEIDPNYGNLVPVSIDNARSTVEEIRYENFAVHNWQINDRMALESSLVYETSTISQSGDIDNERDFDFLRPKLDYRFDITPSMQLRATIEKTVSQLSFSDFSASTDNSDDDRDTQAGNPEIVQEQTWEYGLNMEYRLPNNVGVFNTRVYYRDIEDVIGRVDVSTSPDDLESARGNIGDGKRYGINLDLSTRLGYLGVPNALLTVGFGTADSEVIDPFLGTERRLERNWRGFGRVNFRHDVTAWDFSYGLNAGFPVNGGTGQMTIDIEDIEVERREPFMSAFLEKKAFGGLTFRFDVRNALDTEECRQRTRFVGATVMGVLEEIENSCSGDGVNYALRVRHTF